jgi:magnesium transporter
MLVNCVAYQDGKRLGEIPVPEIGAFVSRPECFVWVALADPEPAELAVMQEQFGLHALAVEDAQKGEQRPKAEEYGDALFVVLHTVEQVDGVLLVGEVDIFVGRNYVLSVRNRSRRGFTDVRARCEREPELLRQGAGFVLYAIMDAVVDRYFPVIDAIEEELERAEERILQGAPVRENVENLYALKRKLTVVQHAVRPALEAAGKLYGGRVPQVCAGAQEYYRDVYDHLLRMSQTLEGLRDTATTAMGVNLSLISLQENETTKRLAAYAALIAVPTLIAGLYGMNFEHMPELKWYYGYPFALATMTFVDLYIYWRFRKAGWV